MPLLNRLRGRAAFCRDRAEIKTPELLEQAAALIEELVEALEEARLIVANLPHGESLFLAKIDAALTKARVDVGATE